MVKVSKEDESRSERETMVAVNVVANKQNETQSERQKKEARETTVTVM